MLCCVTYSRVNNSRGEEEMGIFFLVPIFKVGLRNVSFLGRQILWGCMNSVVLSCLSYMKKLFWLSLALKITLVLLEKFRNVQKLDSWQSDSWAQTHWADFLLKPRSICKPTHFTLLSYVSSHLPKAKVSPLHCRPGTHQQKYYSFKLSPSGDLHFPE